MKRHYGKFKNEEVVVLGYNKTLNAVMICRVNYLPADEQAQLRSIASSSYAQSSCDFLIPILGIERHKSGKDWFTYLAFRLHRNDGSVLSLPLKEVVELDTDQKNFFKGWGTSVAEARTIREQRGIDASTGKPVATENTLADEAPVDYNPITPLEATPVPTPQSGVPSTAVDVPNITDEEAKPYVDREAMMLQLMQQMVEGQKQIADGMASLEKKVGGRKTTPRKKVVRKKATAKPAVLKSTAPMGDATGEEAPPAAE